VHCTMKFVRRNSNTPKTLPGSNWTIEEKKQWR
jgi:hypothetical protein